MADTARHPFNLHREQSAPLSAAQLVWTPADGTMPAMYLSHGAPPLFEHPRWMGELFDWAQSLPKPKAILIVSAHWESAPLMLSSTEQATPLVYDFYGFEQRYYQMTYPTPDAGWLARRVAGVMPQTDPVYEHPSRGLDHGAWVPLKVMYPNADVPVLQMSIPTDDPAELIGLGKRLRPLRDEGVLIIGSGFMTHGLPFLRREHTLPGAPAPGWSSDFDAWAADALDRGDVEELARFRNAPGMPYAHPTVEHYIPLFVTLGAATNPERPPKTAIDGYFWGFARRSFQID
ncbi:MAG: class III extradiol ring-cleavage dioxygenase [Acidimicrobiia bacterium]|nr:class III extradiol ring-cleavage dioxygenase [Acidimicrobiia bacterium]